MVDAGNEAIQTANQAAAEAKKQVAQAITETGEAIASAGQQVVDAGNEVIQTANQAAAGAKKVAQAITETGEAIARDLKSAGQQTMNYIESLGSSEDVKIDEFSGESNRMQIAREEQKLDEEGKVAISNPYGGDTLEGPVMKKAQDNRNIKLSVEVKSGDSLWNILESNGYPNPSKEIITSILSINGIEDAKKIQPGTIIEIPGEIKLSNGKIAKANSNSTSKKS